MSLFGAAKTCVDAARFIAVELAPQRRFRYIDWRMRRDARRRVTLQQLGPLRENFEALASSSDILPVEIVQAAKTDLLDQKKLPLDANYKRVHRRCIVTSRARGICHDWRLSRLVWRHMVDYNKMSGIMRAWWG